MFTTVGFIGCGNMGGAMARAVRMVGPEVELFFANRSPEKAETLAAQLGGQVVDNLWAAKNCSLIFLGVKPQIMPQVLEELAPVLAQRTDRFVLLTMAAGLTMERIRQLAGGDYPVARIMPNTPAAIGAGVIQLCTRDVTEEEKQELTLLLSGAGLVDELEEHLIDAACAVSGCGPAFAYMFMDALAKSGADCGLPYEKALLYAGKMLEGAARLAVESGRSPKELRDAVCSPGGATIQGVKALEDNGFETLAGEAVRAAYRRTLELK
ncbi:MAG: pyrroline-5-carboxylate reductase [Oscillospiraceae bacterium]|nr:pyrroline-5-carboxylate reductase [Oscillospiraceae bacterium]